MRLEGHAASPAQTAGVLHLAPLQTPLTGQMPSVAQGGARTWRRRKRGSKCTSRRPRTPGPRRRSRRCTCAGRAGRVRRTRRPAAVHVAPPQTPVRPAVRVGAARRGRAHARGARRRRRRTGRSSCSPRCTCPSASRPRPSRTRRCRSRWPCGRSSRRRSSTCPSRRRRSSRRRSRCSRGTRGRCCWCRRRRRTSCCRTWPPSGTSGRSCCSSDGRPRAGAARVAVAVAVLVTNGGGAVRARARADPVPAPHELLSHWALLWHAAALVLHVPAVDPVPAPHELLSQSVVCGRRWRCRGARAGGQSTAGAAGLAVAVPAPMADVRPGVAAGPVAVPPQELLSQSAFCGRSRWWCTTRGRAGPGAAAAADAARGVRVADGARGA